MNLAPALNAEVEAVVAKARHAQREWSATRFRDRARALRRLAAYLRRDDALVRIICDETGKPAFEAVAFEVAYVCELVRFLTSGAGRRALATDTRSSLIFPHKRARVAWQPRGVVAVLGPWNFPLLNNFGDAVAPLLAGNAVVLKPSPLTPATSRRVLELWQAAGLPPGLFQVVEGDAEAGQALVDACDMVFMTGSVAGGRSVAARAGERLIPCVAELGGKSAMIVLGDADLKAAARAAVWGAFAGAGQVCIRVERLFVEQSVADELARLIATEARELRMGSTAADRSQGPTQRPDDGGDYDVGGIVMPSLIGRYRAQIADALARGARMLVGEPSAEELPDGFFAPTVLDHVPVDAVVVHEETFGPVLPIVRVRDADEAVRLTNGSSLGLSGSVWSRNQQNAYAIARRLETGSVCVNDTLVNYFFVAAPIGAARHGGLGFRHGAEAMRQFCYPQSVVEDRPWLGPVAGWVRAQLGFPYRRSVLSFVRAVMKWLYR